MSEFHKWRKSGTTYRPYCKPCRSAQRKNEEFSPEYKQSRKDYMLLQRHNITREQWNALVESQGGVCAICRQVPTGAKGFAVDHDHECCPGEKTCGKCIRGLLCGPCNMGIGFLGDSASRVEAAANYLKEKVKPNV